MTGFASLSEERRIRASLAAMDTGTLVAKLALLQRTTNLSSPQVAIILAILEERGVK